MPERNNHLEQTTQTDLLYRSQPDSGAGLALADEAVAPSSASTVSRGDSGIRQHAATRADSSLTAATKQAGQGKAASARRWSYPFGKPFAPLATQVAIQIQSFTSWRRRLRRALRSSLSFGVSFVVHVMALLAMLVVAVPQVVELPSITVLVPRVPPPVVERAMKIDAPLVALPQPYDTDTPQQVELDLIVPDTTPDPGAMTGTPSLASVSTPTASLYGPIDEIRGLVDKARGSGKATAGTGKGAEYFGTKASGNRFVFVVDCSLSMREKNRWVQAATELCAALDRLEPEQLFYVILFDGAVHRMFNHDERQAALFPATPDNIARCKEWLASVQLGPETRPFFAVRGAFELGPDAIYLLSDGEFNDGTAEFLKKVNRAVVVEKERRHPVVVHTFNFHNRDGQATLRRIAIDNGGQYRFLPAR